MSDRNSNILEKFKFAVTGQVYTTYGLRENPFYIAPKKPTETLIGREKEVNNMILSIGHMLRGEVSHIAIIGEHGIGKTHFLYFFKETLEKPDIKAVLNCSKIILIKGLSDFKELLLEPTSANLLITDYIKRRQVGEVSFFLFDDLDVICQRYPQDMSLLFEKLDGAIIGTWDSQAWKRNKIGAPCKIPKTEVVTLLRLPPQECIHILKQRLDEAALHKYELLFPNFVLEGLTFVSKGNTYRLLTCARLFLNHIIENDVREVAKGEFDRFMEDKFNLVSSTKLKTDFSNLSEKQKKIIQILIEKIELTAGELGTDLGISRVGALQHLQTLLELGFVDSKRKGRSVVFSIPTDLQDDIMSWLGEDSNKLPKLEDKKGGTNIVA